MRKKNESHNKGKQRRTGWPTWVPSIIPPEKVITSSSRSPAAGRTGQRAPKRARIDSLRLDPLQRWGRRARCWGSADAGKTAFQRPGCGCQKHATAFDAAAAKATATRSAAAAVPALRLGDAGDQQSGRSAEASLLGGGNGGAGKTARGGAAGDIKQNKPR